MIRHAVIICELKAREKEINFVWECLESILMSMNSPLSEHALVTLIDNAINYIPIKI